MNLPWASMWDKLRGRQCRAVREPRAGDSNFFGRCELKKGHAGDHALERAFFTPTWSTDWTGQ